jgi:hypothetical protein
LAWEFLLIDAVRKNAYSRWRGDFDGGACARGALPPVWPAAGGAVGMVENFLVVTVILPTAH